MKRLQVTREVAAALRGEVIDEQACIVCGCTDTRACPGGCSWAREGIGPVCSNCLDEVQL